MFLGLIGLVVVIPLAVLFVVVAMQSPAPKFGLIIIAIVGGVLAPGFGVWLILDAVAEWRRRHIIEDQEAAEEAVEVPPEDPGVSRTTAILILLVAAAAIVMPWLNCPPQYVRGLEIVGPVAVAVLAAADFIRAKGRRRSEERKKPTDVCP